MSWTLVIDTCEVCGEKKSEYAEVFEYSKKYYDKWACRKCQDKLKNEKNNAKI